jgi:hypothetical protein
LANLNTSKTEGDAFYKDSRNVGLWAKKRMKELGVDLGPKWMKLLKEAGRERFLRIIQIRNEADDTEFYE